MDSITKGLNKCSFCFLLLFMLCVTIILIHFKLLWSWQRKWQIMGILKVSRNVKRNLKMSTNITREPKIAVHLKHMGKTIVFQIIGNVEKHNFSKNGCSSFPYHQNISTMQYSTSSSDWNIQIMVKKNRKWKGYFEYNIAEIFRCDGKFDVFPCGEVMFSNASNWLEIW